MLCLSYYCLGFLSYKIRDKGRTGSAWKRGGGEKRDGALGIGEKWPKQRMHM
jgi:hypothetical protein